MKRPGSTKHEHIYHLLVTNAPASGCFKVRAVRVPRCDITALTTYGPKTIKNLEVTTNMCTAFTECDSDGLCEAVRLCHSLAFFRCFTGTMISPKEIEFYL